MIQIIKEITHYSDRKENIEINLMKEEIIYGNHRVNFKIDSFKKKCLLEGLDDIALSLQKSDQITAFENKVKQNKPWIS